MSDEMIAYCGLRCTDCAAQIATQQGDMAMLAGIARWTKQETGRDVTAESVMCDGCKSNGRLIDYCAQCKVRACAAARGVPTCAHCDDYGCQTLRDLFDYARGAEQMRASLEKLRRSL